MKPWRLSSRQGVVLVEFDPGAVVTNQMRKDIYCELNADPQKYRTTNIVYDMRNIELDQSVNYENLIEVVEYFQASRESWWTHNKTALVVSSKVAYGLSRMYATLAEESLDYEVRVFDNDLESAISWAQPSG